MADIFTIEITGLEKVLDTLDKLSQRASDIRPIANTIGLIAQGDVDERFNSSPGVRQGGQVYGGVTWDSLTEAYLRANPRREGGQIMRDTGELLNSFTVGGKGNVFEAQATQITFGSALPKATGLHRKRPILVVHDDLVQAIAAAMEAWIVEGTK